MTHLPRDVGPDLPLKVYLQRGRWPSECVADRWAGAKQMIEAAPELEAEALFERLLEVVEIFHEHPGHGSGIALASLGADLIVQMYGQMAQRGPRMSHTYEDDQGAPLREPLLPTADATAIAFKVCLDNGAHEVAKAVAGCELQRQYVVSRVHSQAPSGMTGEIAAKMARAGISYEEQIQMVLAPRFLRFAEPSPEGCAKGEEILQALVDGPAPVMAARLAALDSVMDEIARAFANASPDDQIALSIAEALTTRAVSISAAERVRTAMRHRLALSLHASATDGHLTAKLPP